MLTRATVERVLTLYTLGPLQGFSIAPHGTVNETAFVETAAGRFVVRRNQPRIGRADMRRRHALLAHLSQQGFPAPAPVPTSAGASAADLDGRLYEVSPFIPGADFTLGSPSQQVAVGRTLAAYHLAVAGFPPGPPPDQPRYSPAIALGLLERLLERDVMGDLAAELNWYDRRATDLRRRLPPTAASALPRTLIHGDIHRDNLLFAGDEVSALLDYDQIECEARVTDVVDGLIAFATDERRPGWSPWGAYKGPLDPDAAARLLGGYTEVCPLSAAELTAIPILVESAWLQGELRRVLATPDGAPEYHQDVLGQGKALAAWMEANGGLLAEALAAPAAV